MDKTLKKLNAGYSGMQGGYWMLYCMVLSFASVFLLSRGYSGTEIGVIMAVSNVFALVFQPVFAGIADRSPKFGVIKMLWLLCAAAAVILLIICFVSVRGAVLTVTYTLVFALVIVIQPFMTSLTIKAEGLGLHINYGVSRGIGSLAFSVLSTAMGALLEKFDTVLVPVTALAALGIFCLCLLIFGVLCRGRQAVSAPVAEREALGVFSFIKENKRFAVFLSGVALLFFAHSVHNNFLIFIVQNVGGGQSDMGYIFAYMALLEMPAMLFFDRLCQKWRCSALLKFAVVMFSVKAVAIFLAPSVPWLYGAFFFQAFSFALYIPAGVRYAMLVVDSRDSVKAQAFVCLTGTLGSIFASLCGGILFDTIGATPALLVGAVATIIGSIISFAAVVQTGGQEE